MYIGIGREMDGYKKNSKRCFEHDLIYSQYNVVLINLHFYTYCAKK